MGLDRMSSTERALGNSYQYLGTLRDEAVDKMDAWYKQEEAIYAYWCGVVVALKEVLGHVWPDIPPEPKRHHIRHSDLVLQRRPNGNKCPLNSWLPIMHGHS